MRSPQYHRRQQKATVFVALMLFSLVLFLIQLWLFVLVLEGFLGKEGSQALPAAIGSAVLFAVNLWMLLGVNKLFKLK